MAFGNTVTVAVNADIGPFRRGLLSAQSELGKFSTKLSSGKVLTSVLTGVGIGSGFALAEKAAAMIAGYWERSAKAAESIATFSTQATDSVLKRLRLRNTDEQNLKLDTTREAALRREAAGLLQTRTERSGGRGFGRRTVGPTEDQRVKAAEKLAEAEALAVTNEQLKIKIEKEAAEATKRAADEEQRRIEQQREAVFQLASERRSARDRENKEGDELLAEQREQEKKDAERREREVESLREKEIKAAKDIADARENISTAISDASGATFSEVQSGQRGSSADRARARQVARLEARARRFRDDPNLVLERTAENGDKLKLSGKTAADVLTQEAGIMRNGIDSLTSAERDPLKAYKDALKTSEEELAKILKALTDEAT